MTSKICLATLLFCLSIFTIKAQDNISPEDLAKIQSYEDTVALLSFAIINDSLPEHRFASCRKVIPTLVNALKIENSFSYSFSKLQSISIQYPRDSSFRVFTWQLFVDDNDYRYYGAIQMNSSELKLFPLVDRSFEVRDLEREPLTPKSWYGALYYNIRQFDSPQGPKYLLFGFDGLSFFNKRKLVDVLSFQNGEPEFGREPVFVKINQKNGQKMPLNRLVLEYTSAAAVRLNYDESLGHIMHDHLIMSGAAPGGGPSFVPDGSYQGYELKGGFWVNIPKVYDQVLEDGQAPRDFPVLDSENANRERKNIFGKKGKPKAKRRTNRP